MKKKNGSVMILTMVAVLILSILLTGLLTVGTTEIYTTENYQLNKTAYYTAVQGVEEVRNLIYNTPDTQSVTTISRSTYETEYYDAFGVKRSYITGTLRDMETSLGTGVPIGEFEGFVPPPLPGISLSGTNVSPIVWKVVITADVSAGQSKKKTAYVEIVSGVLSIASGSYGIN